MSKLKKVMKILLIVLNFSLIALALSINIPACLGADSPQYILSSFAVDSTGTSLTPVNPTINPSANVATIAIAVTTQIPTGLTVSDNGFTISASGTSKVGLDSVSFPVTTVQNQNGSVTSKFVLQLSVPSSVDSPIVGFTYYVKVVDTVGQPAVTHESTQLQFTVTTSSTPTPTPTASPTPTPTSTPTSSSTANPSPTVPEFPILIPVCLAAIISLITVGFKIKQNQNKFGL